MSQSDLTICNSTAEFLIFEKQSHADSIEVRYEDETLWLTQKMMAQLFDVSVKTINEQLRNIFKSGELERQATIRKFQTVQTEGSRHPKCLCGLLRYGPQSSLPICKTLAKERP